MQNRVFSAQEANEAKARLEEQSKGSFCVYRQGKWRVQKKLRTYDILYVLKGDKWVKKVPNKEQKDNYALYL